MRRASVPKLYAAIFLLMLCLTLPLPRPCLGLSDTSLGIPLAMRLLPGGECCLLELRRVSASLTQCQDYRARDYAWLG